jgi:hypothetical protein
MNSQLQQEIYNHREYWGRILAISNDKIIAIDDDYNSIFEKAAKITKDFHCYTVPKRLDLYQIKTFRIKSMQNTSMDS